MTGTVGPRPAIPLGIGTKSGSASAAKDPFAHAKTSSDIRRVAQNLANTSWDDLNNGADSQGRKLSTGPGAYVNDVEHPGPAPVWFMSQAQAAALDLGALTNDYRPAQPIDDAMNAHYLTSRAIDGNTDPAAPTFNGYVPGFGADQSSSDHGDGNRYTDDNMAIGLNYMQAYHQTNNSEDLKKAENIFPFLEAMQKDGKSLNWREGSTAYVSDSIAGAQKFALMLAQSTQDPTLKARCITFAHNLDDYLEKNMRVSGSDLAKRLGTKDKLPDGLVIDNLDATNETAAWKNDIFSYNQGWSVGADVEWFKTTGDKSKLARAHRTADAALKFLKRHTSDGKPSADGLWKQPPSFNANFFKDLLALEAIDPDPKHPHKYEDALKSYLTKAWTQGRDPQQNDPWFDKGGIGTFTGNSPGRTSHLDMIDQAGMVQMYALLAMTPEQRAKLD